MGENHGLGNSGVDGARGDEMMVEGVVVFSEVMVDMDTKEYRWRQ